MKTTTTVAAAPLSESEILSIEVGIDLLKRAANEAVDWPLVYIDQVLEFAFEARRRVDRAYDDANRRASSPIKKTKWVSGVRPGADRRVDDIVAALDDSTLDELMGRK